MRYVVLHHTGVAEPHYDVMVETAAGSPLATWRSPMWPWVGETPLVRLADHRAAYLDYEGPVSGGRSQVARVASGMCEVSVADDAHWTIRTDNGGFEVRPAADGQWVGRPRPF